MTRFQFSMELSAVSAGSRTSSMAAEVSYPDYKRAKLGFSKETLTLYEGDVEIAITLKSPAARFVTLSAQACNNEICLLPEKITLRIPPLRTADVTRRIGSM